MSLEKTNYTENEEVKRENKSKDYYEWLSPLTPENQNKVVDLRKTIDFMEEKFWEDWDYKKIIEKLKNEYDFWTWKEGKIVNKYWYTNNPLSQALTDVSKWVLSEWDITDLINIVSNKIREAKYSLEDYNNNKELFENEKDIKEAADKFTFYRKLLENPENNNIGEINTPYPGTPVFWQVQNNTIFGSRIFRSSDNNVN